MHGVVSVIPALSEGSSSSLTDEGSSPQRAWARHVPFASVCVHTRAKNDRGDSENPASRSGTEASGDVWQGSPAVPAGGDTATPSAQVASASGTDAACLSPGLPSQCLSTPGMSIASSVFISKLWGGG